MSQRAHICYIHQCDTVYVQWKVWAWLSSCQEGWVWSGVFAMGAMLHAWQGTAGVSGQVDLVALTLGAYQSRYNDERCVCVCVWEGWAVCVVTVNYGAFKNSHCLFEEGSRGVKNSSQEKIRWEMNYYYCNNTHILPLNMCQVYFGKQSWRVLKNVFYCYQIHPRDCHTWSL